jgi:hypothetical protein
MASKPKITAPQAQGARRDGGHTIPPRLAAETNERSRGDGQRFIFETPRPVIDKREERHEQEEGAPDQYPANPVGTGNASGGTGGDRRGSESATRSGADAERDLADGDGVVENHFADASKMVGRAEMPTLDGADGRHDLPTKKQVGKPLSAHEKTVGETVGKPVGNLLGNPLGKPVGISVGKPVGNPQNQQLTGNQPVSRPRKKRADFFRYELDFRPLKKGGYNVLIRKRLRWSDARYSNTVVRRKCPRLTAQMVAKIRLGKFTDAAIEALRDGGIEHGFITQLLARIGKGNGQRRADLTDYERSILTGIEFVLASSRGSRDADTDRGSGRPVDVPGDNLPDASDDGDARVSYVH